MYKINLDTADRYEKSVHLLKDGLEIDSLAGEIDVVSSIKKILERNSVSLAQIEEVSFNKGPGSYTGLRIGSTISNIINWALLKKSLNNLEYPEYGSEPNITPPKKKQTLE